MKTKILVIVAAFAVSLTSCKKENESKPAENGAPKVEGKQNFSVDLDVSASKEDYFVVYYTENNSNNFDGDHAVWSGIKGGESKTLTFDLPEEVIPTNIRIDFGIKKGEERGDVTLQKFKINFYGKSFEAKGSDFLKYFIKNDSTETEIDEVKGTIKFKRNVKSKLEPFYFPQQTILDEVSKITK